MKLSDLQRKELTELLIHSLFGEYNDDATRILIRNRIELLLHRYGVDSFWITIADDPDIIDRHGFEMNIWFPDQTENIAITLYPATEPRPENPRPQDIHVRIG